MWKECASRTELCQAPPAPPGHSQPSVSSASGAQLGKGLWARSIPAAAPAPLAMASPLPSQCPQSGITSPAQDREEMPIPRCSHHPLTVCKLWLTGPIIFPVIQTVCIVTASYFSRDSLKSLISFQIRVPIKLDIINMMSRGFPTA